MKSTLKIFLCSSISIATLCSCTTTERQENSNSTPTVCQGFGPQTPRDIDNTQGENTHHFSLAAKREKMDLCNIHFHDNAEHKAKDFSIYAGEGDGHGHNSGYQCAMASTLTAAELAPTANEVCNGVKPGDTVEVHWVFTSCNETPGPGLGSCLSEKCSNPELRVEAQVFTVVNDENALNFHDLEFGGNIVNGYEQPKSLPKHTGEPVEFTGSTTGPSYSEQVCSPFQVTWSVRPQCTKVNIRTLGEWCESNVFEEDHAHGVRKLVTTPSLLSVIK